MNTNRIKSRYVLYFILVYKLLIVDGQSFKNLKKKNDIINNTYIILKTKGLE